MSEPPTGSDRVELTDAEYDQLSDALKLEPPTPGAPMYYVGGIDDVVASIVAARVQALTAEVERLKSLRQSTASDLHRDWAQDKANYAAECDAARAELAAANAKISKWAEDYKKLAHDCGGTELEHQALAARCAELEAAVEQEITTRDQYADLLDRFAAAIPGDHGEHSSGNDPWTNALASAAALQATLDRVTADRIAQVLRDHSLIGRKSQANRTVCVCGNVSPTHDEHRIHQAHELRAALTPEGTE